MKRTQRRKLDVFTRLVVVASLVLIAVATSAGSALAAPPVPAAKPLVKNIIIMIADGSGYNQNDAATLYQYGTTGVQPWEAFPFQFAVSTFSTDGWGYDPALAWSDFNYVKTHYTDSAAAATAMATGVKTYDAGIGVDDDGHPVENILERAEAKGKSTGVVTTVEISHATPAGFVAHNVSRDDYTGITQEMILDSATDVIMGAGHPWFDNSGLLKATPNTYKYVGGQSTWDALVAGTVASDVDEDGVDEPTTLIQDRAEFQALMSGPTPERVVGVAKVYETMQERRAAADMFAAPYVAPLTESVPTLPEMSLAAINLLDNDADGFVLMIEGGSNYPGRTIEERIDFNNAVEAVMAWIQQNSNWGETLLIVTADHETGYLTGPGSGAPATWLPLVNNGAGVQPGMQFNSLNHTNSLVPLWAKGDAGRFFRQYALHTDPVHGKYIDNTNIANVMFNALGPK
jgi:alkaline phosphatase